MNNPSLSRLRLDTNPKLASLPDEMFSSGHTLVDVKINGTAIETLPANFIAALAEIGALDLPSTLTAWPTGFVLPDTLYRLKIRGNETFRTLPDSVLSSPLPQSLTDLRIFDIQLSDATLVAIGAHQAVDIYGGSNPPPKIAWFDFYLANTGITGAELTDLINGWCYNVPSCPNWNGPQELRLANEDLSDWLDPDGNATTLADHRAAVQRMNLGSTLLLSNTQMSAAQVTELLTHMPKDQVKYITLQSLDLDGLDIGSTTFTFSQFTSLLQLQIFQSQIGDATAEKIIEDLPPAIQLLSLQSNNIQTVPVFPSYRSMSTLYLHRNQLETVTAGAFDNLPALLSLTLSYGELESIPTGMLDNNPKLRWLYLNNNQLGELPAGIFDNNADLSYLYLNDNGLTELSAELLHNVIDERLDTKLSEINLSDNLLTELPAGFFDGRKYLTTLNLSNNLLTGLPDGSFRDALLLEYLYLNGNKLGLMPSDFAYLTRLVTLRLEDKVEEVEVEAPTSLRFGAILRIEPSIRSVTLRAGDMVRLAVDVYGRQELLDSSLAIGRTLIWDDGDAGGVIVGGGAEITYAAPENPGRYTVTANVSEADCFGNENQCSATFEITVRRPSAAVEPTPAPVNPAGTIPTILTDSDGN